MAKENRRSQTKTSMQPSLIHAIQANAANKPDTVCLSWVNTRCQVDNAITYNQLWSRTAAVAELLLQSGVKQGDRVMIAYPFGLEFQCGFFGCMRMGAIPCSVYPPNPEKSKAKHSFSQFNNQVKDAGAKIALTTGRFKRTVQALGFLRQKTDVKWLATDDLREPKDTDIGAHGFVPKSDDIAFIQYSSGSTGVPKGIVISHEAVLYNATFIRDQIDVTGGEHVGVSWLPQYHDLCLMSFVVLSAVEPSFPSYLASPVDFIKNPLLWADMIEKFSATYTAGPNFGYRLLSKRMTACGRKLQDCQLSVAGIGAEPIDPTTIDKMVDIGIQKEYICPCYGFAEICMYATGCRGNDIMVRDGLVSCGHLELSELAQKFVVTVDDERKIIKDGSVGEVYARGPDMASGYWGRPQLTVEAFKNRLEDDHEYFKTGDLGRIVDGKLYIAGRLKEVIIINGRNVYPTDLERLVEAEYSDLVRPGSTVAYQHSELGAGIVMELRKTADEKQAARKLRACNVRTLIGDAYNISMDAITMLKQGSIPKTTSGKLRRVETRQISLAGNWAESSIVWTWKKDIQENDDIRCTHNSNPIDENDESHDPAASGIEQIFKNVLQERLDEKLSWEENGLSSLQHAELATQINERLGVQLPGNFDDLYRTPLALKVFIETSAPTKVFSVVLPSLHVDTSKPLRRQVLELCQIAGVLFQLIMLTSSFVPAYFAGKVAIATRSTFEVGDSGRSVTWSWLQIVIPAFMLSFSLLTIAVKWIFVGRYRSRQINVFSKDYVQWWVVDRLVHTWEMWVGTYIKGTPMIWIFYRLMGAKIHPSANVKAFVREFDLVSVGCNSTINHEIRCRRFGAWSVDTGCPSLRFRPVSIGEDCTIEGMVGLGCVIGHKARVDHLSVLQEGSQVEAGAVAAGNPAHIGTEPASAGYKQVSWQYGLAKVIWLFTELYIFAGLMLASEILWNGRLPMWRYQPLMYWILVLATTSVFSTIASAILKWVIIGRRTDEQRSNPSFWTTLADWICDYHFAVGLTVLNWGIPRTTCLWNIILKMHGLDIDLGTGVKDVLAFAPSVVDQLSVRRSFLATGTKFLSGKRIEIIDSTIGFKVVLRAGVKIHRSYVRSLELVNESLYDYRAHSITGGVGQLIIQEIMTVCFVLMICLSFIPAFEVFQWTSLSNGSFGLAWLGFVASVAVQLITWMLFCRMYQSAILVLRLLGANALFVSSYHCFLHMVTAGHFWGHWHWMWGTSSIYSFFLRFMGASVKGDLLFNGNRTHDFSFLEFEDKTIVDTCQLGGHYQMGTNLIVGRSVHSGVLLPGCFTLAGTYMSGSSQKERGPWRTILANEMIKNESTELELDHEEPSETISSNKDAKV